MSNDATPRGMLALYRQNVSEFTALQIELFRKMPAAERMELLFLMLINTNQSLQHIHSLIDPNIKTVGMPDPEAVN